MFSQLTGTLVASAVMCAMVYHPLVPLRGEPPPLLYEHELWAGSESSNASRQFEVHFSDVVINDLKERLMHRRPFTPPLNNAGFTNGFNTIYIETVLDFWKNSYDFKGRATFLNKYDHLKSTVQGLDMHFVHVKPSAVGPNVKIFPIMLLHGWPGSFTTMYKLIPLLTTPRDGYDFMFEVVVPSLPGFGYSQAPDRVGFGTPQAAVVLRNLMHRLGHRQFYLAAEGIGSYVASDLSTLYPSEVLGLHSSFLVRRHNNYQDWFDILLNYLYPADFSYFNISRPETIGVGLTDSPAGSAAFILDKFAAWTSPDRLHTGDGNLLGQFSLVELLDNVMVYWTTVTAVTSMRLAMEGTNLDGISTDVPTCRIKFKHQLIDQSKFVLERKFTNIVQSTYAEGGGHFPALEHPSALADDVFKCVHKVDKKVQ